MRTVTKSKRSANRKPKVPKTLEEYSGLPERSQDIWVRVTHVVSKMRAGGIPLYQASQEVGIDPRTVIRWGRSALRKHANGRYAAKSRDQLLRVLAIPTRLGLREIAVRDSRQATQLAKYWDAVQKYLRTGDASGLKKFRGVRLTDADGTAVPLLTGPAELDRLGSAGVLSFESLYARTS